MACGHFYPGMHMWKQIQIARDKEGEEKVYE